MFVRVYTEPPVPLSTLSFEAKRKRLLLERGDVDKIEMRESEGFMKLISSDNEEIYDYQNCLLEVLNKDPKDGLSDGLALSY